MALIACFAGTRDIVKKCKNPYRLVINLTVRNRPRAKFEGTAFDVGVGGPNTRVTLTGEACITLEFNDQAQYTVTVTHASGFTGAAQGTPGSPGAPPSVSVVLTKPWNLVVVAKEKWPEKDEKAFAKAKVKIEGASSTAGEDGKIESNGLTGKRKLTLDVKGLRGEKCKSEAETRLATTEDGFLGAEDPTVARADGKAIEIAGDQPGATVTVTYVMEVTVVKPGMTADAIALLDPKYAGYTTTLSELSLQIQAASHPADDLTEIRAALTFDAKIKCYKDDKATKEYVSDTKVAPAALPAKLYIKGQEKGESKLALKLTTEREESDRSWRIDPEAAEAKAAVWVEKLKLDLWKYSEGKDSEEKASGTPLTRELHNRNGGIFTAARVSIAAPESEFWRRGGVIALSPTDKVSLFKDDKLTVAVSELKQTDFTAGPCKFWAQGTGAAGCETEVDLDWRDWKREPAKLTDKRQDVSCGAKVGSRNLRYGDVIKLETYALDVHLDRMASNECRKRVVACYGIDADTYEIVTKSDVALAYAAAHKYYAKQSLARVNKNYNNAGYAIFSGFMGAISAAKRNGGDTNTWSTSAAGWIKNRLAEHGITLHAKTQEMIRVYIKSVLAAGMGEDDAHGFDVTRGVPGVHAEVLAVNDIFNGVLGIEADDITVATYRLQDSSGGQGYRFVACTNCRGILLGGVKKVRVITG